ncbi:MAG: hypothetical protein EP329_11575, partial [Deltaproteobacteria bacterium]
MRQFSLDLGQEASVGREGRAILETLNAPQREAVLACDGPLLILAGAGSGKTRALTRKIAFLVAEKKLEPWQILAVTFTNKAAAEMRERCEQLLGPRAADLWLGTFHSIGVRILRRHGELIGVPRGFVIYDQDDATNMIGRCLDKLGLDSKAFPPKGIGHWIEAQKRECRGPDHAEIPQQSFTDRTHLRVYALYQEEMRKAGAVDFSDLIWLPWRLATEHPTVAFEYKSRWRYVLVDEFQDTNVAQYKLLKAFLNDDHHICVVGDDDQSIYGWRGAQVENILGFDRDFADAKVIRLEQNYRSTQTILDVSGALIAQNTSRHGKTLWTERERGEAVRVYPAQTERDEAEYVGRRIDALRHDYDLSEMAIFYRTNAQSRAFEDVLRAKGIPYRVLGGLRFYDRAEVKDVLAYLKVLANPSDPVSLERIINRPTRGIGKTTVDKCRQRGDEDGSTLWEAICAMAREAGGALSSKLSPFVELIVDLVAYSAGHNALETALELLEKTSYLALLEADRSIEAQGRADNVKELLGAIGEFVERSADRSLGAFLDEVSLVSDLDGADLSEQTVSLMTGHSAKGLEFDVVFVTGLEEGLIPHFNSSDSQSGIEEERRLAYVAMTRARHVLHLSHAASRRRFGQSKAAVPSRFLDGLPDRLLHQELGGYTLPPRTSGWSGGPGGWGGGSGGAG